MGIAPKGKRVEVPMCAVYTCGEVKALERRIRRSFRRGGG